MGAVAPRKDPVAPGTPNASASNQPMGPPYPEPEIPKPARPADMPPSPPQVTYRDGMLTVHALNSTMSSVLQAIRSKTGIEFEGAGNSSERVAVNMGPAPEGDVLATIFSGSSFDYVVLGRADSPGIVQRVILTPRAKGGAAVAGGPPQPFRPQQPGVQAQQQAEEDTNDEAVQADEDPQDAPNQAPQVQEPPAAQNEPQQPQQNETQQNENQQNENQQNENQQNAPKTPEQLLQELKQMQLQQQQQQGQPPPDTNSVPRKAPPR
jgi:hypothetical protein